ncbi:MAG TPA: serine/threonine-protein kinase [Gemmatimonadales bacterium]|jgi:serine/threonine-protein kinase|nr:serine/threonine-protein kinase [Gemmatimonadales bacterium]
MSLEAEELLGRAIGPFTVERLIGQGGFAWVFAGRRTADGTPVALKILKPRYAGDQQFESRFRNEARVASELRHPNIVRILDIGKTGEVTYFAMDLYPGSLASRLARDGPPTEGDLLRIARDVTSALAFAHAGGIIHRDIKVDNILFTADGTAVIADFGIARAVSGYATATGVNMTIGTPHYVSPEQAQGRPLDGRSDLYALGVTLYKAATGDLPFRSNDWFELARMHVEEAPEPPRNRRPDLSKRTERIILKCLAKHPDDRYASADELLAELDAVEQAGRRTESFGMAAARLPTDQRAPGAGILGKWLLPVAAVAVVILVALLVVVLGRR